jgi:sialate O-acetylesterase
MFQVRLDRLIIVFVLFILPQITSANIRLNALFADHMVVQRETIIPVWGWANPGEKVEVQASWGEKEKVVAGKDSTWQVKIKTPEAGGPFQIIIKGKNTIEIKDVLSGDVWLCTGQSNMDFPMRSFINDSREPKYQPLVEYMRNEIATANDPLIRHIEVSRATSIYKKQTNFDGDWVSVNPDDIGKITAVGYFFAKELRKHIDVPIGIVECAWGGTRIQPWISVEAYLSDDSLKAYYENEMLAAKKRIVEMNHENWVDTVYQRKYDEWIANCQTTRKPSRWSNPETSIDMPATLYNGMLSTIIPFAIKGALWYQGESNSHYLADKYETFFTLLVNSWRTEWGQGDFPFYWAQLAADYIPYESEDLGWASINNQFRRCLKLPNTGMAVLCDIGEAKDVHSHNKIDAGKRFALWALQKDYNIKVPAFSGPLYQSHKIIGNKVVITFDHVGSGLMVGNKQYINEAVSVDMPLTWFEITEDNKEWKRGIAKIISKNEIEVYNLNIDNPVAVRYAWSSNPDGANLYNKEGLPAAVFLTEQ